ncbi:FtsX-like permease family protein [bacterium]|nr:FtsX-like permease family protein [bacterium]MDC1038355.1 FtsX-like permease family protein [Candidatus Neomarinimicrobiota bacterium]
MIRFLIKGILRDRTRSLFPVIVVTLTVAMIVLFQGFLTGIMNSMFLDSAVVSTGHVKVMTRAYQDESQLLPNDLALLETDQLIQELNQNYPDYFWSPRITFGGLLDVPDKYGETRAQGPVYALGIDFLSPESRQTEIWKLENRLIDGKLPASPNEVLLSSKLANKLEVTIGDVVTLIGSTMYNAFTTYNFRVVGTFKLNLGPVDKQMMLVDIEGARLALDMNNAASEILGFNKELTYEDQATVTLRQSYNKAHNDSADIFRPTMMALRDVNQMGTMVDFSNAAMAIMLAIFLIIVMIVLWNMGLMNGLRRYGEIGMRLAMGESKGHVYQSMIIESVIIGFIGTGLGTAIGITITYYMQEVGLDYSSALEAIESSDIIMSNVFYAQVTPELYYIGFIPGVLATVLGTMMAGRAIYKREMAQLFKELET